jgi:moderate conductance mechanosensitive channel
MNPVNTLSQINALQQDTNIWVKLVIILVGSYILNYFVRHAFRGIFSKTSTPKTRTVLQVLQNGVSLIILIIAVLMVLSALNINIFPLLASAGIVGFAIGFGSQSLIKDLIMGLFLITGEVFYEGDIITVMGIEGRVEKVGIRTIRIRDLNGVVFTIPNGNITTVANHTKDWARANIDIGVSSDHPIDQILDIFKNEVEGIKKDEKYGSWIIGSPKVEGIMDISGAKMTIKTLLKTNETKRWDLEREFKYRIKKRFEQENLKFA